MSYSVGGNGPDIAFVLVGKENRKYLRDVKVIPGKHRLVITWLRRGMLRRCF